MGERELIEFLSTVDAMVDGYTCKTPAYGAPGHPHCAACCYGTMIAATCQEEHDFAVALAEVVRTGKALLALGGEPVSSEGTE